MDKKLELEIAWKVRQDFFKKAQELVGQAEVKRSDLFKSSSTTRLIVWYSAVTSYHEMRQLEAQADAYFFQADTVWYDAVEKYCGNIKMTWSDFVSGGYNCRLETGEEFLA